MRLGIGHVQDTKPEDGDDPDLAAALRLSTEGRAEDEVDQLGNIHN